MLSGHFQTMGSIPCMLEFDHVICTNRIVLGIYPGSISYGVHNLNDTGTERLAWQRFETADEFNGDIIISSNFAKKDMFDTGR